MPTVFRRFTEAVFPVLLAERDSQKGDGDDV